MSIKLNTRIIEAMSQDAYDIGIKKALNEFKPRFYLGIEITPYGDTLAVFCANGTARVETEAQKAALMYHLNLKGDIFALPCGVFEQFTTHLKQEWAKPAPAITEFPEVVKRLKPSLRAWDGQFKVTYPYAGM